MVAAAFLLLATSVEAQLYTFNNDEGGAFGTVASGVTASDLTPVNGVAEIMACGTGFSTDTWSTSTAAFTTSYTAIELTLTPSAGVSMSITSIQFDLGRNPQGPQKMRFAYSLDGGGSWITSGVDLSIPSGSCGSGTTFSWNMADFTSTTAVKFRVFGWNAGNVNGQQRNYNGIIGGSSCTLQTWYADTDGDGYGNAGSTTSSCTAPVGYVSNSTDCDDTHSTVYPGAAEICDGLDNDCNLVIDENVVTATISPVDSVWTCRANPVTFSTEPCAGCTYQWYKNDHPLDGATGTTWSTTKFAHYSVTVTVPGGCSDMSDHTYLTTYENPNANIYNPNGLNLCAPSPGGTIIVKTDYHEGYTYQWYRNGDPYAGAGATEWRIFPTETGTYYCHIIAPNGACERNTASRTVINSCKTGSENGLETISIYPNPASDNLTIELNTGADASDAMVIIMNTIGEVLYNQNAVLSNGTLNHQVELNNIPAGVYVVKVVAGDKEFTSNIVVN